jgi:hypothetical protein
MADISRRRFIRTAAVGAAATAGAAVVAPGLLSAAGAAAPAAAPTAPPPAWKSRRPAGAGPLVAHVVDAPSGLIAVYSGTREILIHDTAVARALTAAAG